MKSIVKIITIICLVSIIASCKKNGTGGSATIVAFPQHHGHAIYGATVYVKFKSKEMPTDPTNNYDLKIVGEEKEEHVHIENMLPANYYLYAVGIDSTLVAPNNIVKGGVGVTLKYSQRKQELDIDVPVTE